EPLASESRVDTPADVGREHWCVGYADEAAVRHVAARFLRDAVAHGEQVALAGWDGAEHRRHVLDDVGDVGELFGRGAARIVSFEEAFRPVEPPDPAALLSFWSEATRAALAAGF